MHFKTCGKGARTIFGKTTDKPSKSASRPALNSELGRILDTLGDENHKSGWLRGWQK
jgi:hypothetical protein